MSRHPLTVSQNKLRNWEALPLSRKGKLLFFPNLCSYTKSNSNVSWIGGARLNYWAESTLLLVHQPFKKIFEPRQEGTHAILQKSKCKKLTNKTMYNWVLTLLSCLSQFYILLVILKAIFPFKIPSVLKTVKLYSNMATIAVNFVIYWNHTIVSIVSTLFSRINCLKCGLVHKYPTTN